jgi:nucleotide-binding universal stress UspA family protein
MKKILVPFDFSHQATEAFRFALGIAEVYRSKIDLLHVVEVPVMHDTMLMPTLSFEAQMIKDMKKSAITRFNKLAEKYSSKKVILRTTVVTGPISQVILNHIRSGKPELVVMGTKGSSGMREVIIGSNTEKIVRHSPVPVIAIKKYVKADSIKDIVFPTLLEVEEKNVIKKVQELQKLFKAKLHLVRVNTPTNFATDSEIKESLEKFMKKFNFRNYTFNVYNDKFTDAGIIDFTHKVKGDLIVMATHGRTGISHVVTGSLAEGIVNHADVPVWTYNIHS